MGFGDIEWLQEDEGGGRDSRLESGLVVEVGETFDGYFLERGGLRPR